MMAIMLTSNSIVREKEQGTLEQLFMTPVRTRELIFGKLVPYLCLTMAEFCVISFLMYTAFQVPIHGSFLTLLVIAMPFILGMLGLGLWISTFASTRDASMQLSMGTVIPSISLSGYVFPIESMPPFLPMDFPGGSHHLDDRRRPRRDLARRRLARAERARPGSDRHGAGPLGRQHVPLPQTPGVMGDDWLRWSQLALQRATHVPGQVGRDPQIDQELRQAFVCFLESVKSV